jgi:hypothetical protein
MNNIKSNRSIEIWIVTIVAIIFGLLTIKSGGSVLFIDGIDRENAGNYVPFVLWFNFTAGFLYILSGAGLFMEKSWAAWLSIFIATATIITFSALGLFILNDGLYETRTIGAMSLRTIVWALIATVAYRKIIRS